MILEIPNFAVKWLDPPARIQLQDLQVQFGPVRHRLCNEVEVNGMIEDIPLEIVVVCGTNKSVQK